MARLETLFILVACAIVYFTYRCEGSSEKTRCKICTGVECDKEPKDCLYGTTRDICLRKVCKKISHRFIYDEHGKVSYIEGGPGMRCGGPSNIMGVCGDGMLCRCERCTGCSLDTLQCDMSGIMCLP